MATVVFSSNFKRMVKELPDIPLTKIKQLIDTLFNEHTVPAFGGMVHSRIGIDLKSSPVRIMKKTIIRIIIFFTVNTS